MLWLKNGKKLFVLTVVVLCLAQVAIVLLSWVAAAMFPDSAITSLLSAEGLRWLMSSYEHNVNRSELFYCLIISFVVGTVWESGILAMIAPRKPRSYNQRLGVTIVAVVVLTAVLLCLIFAIYPRSFLLGVDGTIWKGPFFPAILLIMTVSITVATCLFVVVTHSDDTFIKLFSCLTGGLRAIVPIVIIFFLLAEVVCSFRYSMAL